VCVSEFILFVLNDKRAVIIQLKAKFNNTK